MIQSAIGVLVFDPRVREMNVPIEVRQVVLASPVLNLRSIAVGTTIAVAAATIPLLQKLLVLALQVVVENDPLDAGTTVLVHFALVRSTDLSVVFDLACRPQLRVEHLTALDF